MPRCDPRVRYRCLGRVYNSGGAWTELKSDGFTIDDTAPVGGTVVDGDNVHADLDFSADPNSFSVTWTEFVDAPLRTEQLTFLAGIALCNSSIEEV